MSILNQLAKYQTPNEQPIIKVGTTPDDKYADFHCLVLGTIAEAQQLSVGEIKLLKAKLAGLQFTELSDKLYPALILAVYYLGFKWREVVIPEQTIDKILFDFVSQIGPEIYGTQFKSNINPAIRRFVALRCAI